MHWKSKFYIFILRFVGQCLGGYRNTIKRYISKFICLKFIIINIFEYGKSRFCPGAGTDHVLSISK